MPSNKELRAEISEIAGQLNLSVSTRGLNNAALQDLLSDLKAKARDAELSTAADTAEPPESEPPESEPPESEPPESEPPAAPKYIVAPGRSVTTKHRNEIKSAGDEVDEDDFNGGHHDLRNLVKVGAVIES